MLKEHSSPLMLRYLKKVFPVVISEINDSKKYSFMVFKNVWRVFVTTE